MLTVLLKVTHLCMKALIVKLNVIGRFLEKIKLLSVGLKVWDRINSHDKTYTQHEICSACLCFYKGSLSNFEIQLFLNHYFSLLKFTGHETEY